MKQKSQLSLWAIVVLFSALACQLFQISTTAPEPASTSTLAPTLQPSPDLASTPTLVPPATLTTTATQPPSSTAEATGVFRRVTSLAGMLADDSSDVQVRALGDGSVWIITSQSVMRWDGQAWETILSEGDFMLAAVDDGGRLWAMRQDASKIAAWQDGQWTTYDSNSGWTEAFTYEPSWWAPAPWKVYTSTDNTLWLPMGRDVRSFNGEKWSLYTLEDMKFPPPGSDDLEVVHRLVMREGEAGVWVGECYYSGPGPMGGQGVRWFDGKTWHGAEAPVGAECVAVMELDRAGNVWLAAKDVVWRYESASQNWEPYLMPEALLSGYNFPDPRQLIVDARGDVWVIMQLCGGASCSGPALLSRIHDGEWSSIIDSQDAIAPLKRLALDGSGQAWLFWDGAVYWLEEESMQPVATIQARGVGVSSDGRVWVLADDEDGPTLWLLQP